MKWLKRFFARLFRRHIDCPIRSPQMVGWGVHVVGCVDPRPVAIFRYQDQAEEWANATYCGRYRLERYGDDTVTNELSGRCFEALQIVALHRLPGEHMGEVLGEQTAQVFVALARKVLGAHDPVSPRARVNMYQSIEPAKLQKLLTIGTPPDEHPRTVTVFADKNGDVVVVQDSGDARAFAKAFPASAHHRAKAEVDPYACMLRYGYLAFNVTADDADHVTATRIRSLQEYRNTAYGRGRTRTVMAVSKHAAESQVRENL